MTVVNGNTPLSGASLQGLDLETALMAIQSQRASLLEGQLTEQLEGVQKKNEQMGQLNEVLNAARALMGSLTAEQQAALNFNDPNETDPAKKLTAEQLTLQSTLNDACKSAGINADDLNNKNTLDAFISNTKTSIDSLSNSQQMDMLRLQSLTNKRNEAFDVMTNFVKKMQDARSSIIGNMR